MTDQLVTYVRKESGNVTLIFETPNGASCDATISKKDFNYFVRSLVRIALEDGDFAVGIDLVDDDTPCPRQNCKCRCRTRRRPTPLI